MLSSKAVGGTPRKNIEKTIMQNDPLISERDIVRAQIEKATRKFLRSGGKITVIKSLAADTAEKRETACHATAKERKRVFRSLFKKIHAVADSSKKLHSEREKIAARALSVQRQRVQLYYELASDIAPPSAEIEILRRYIEKQ